MLDKGKKAKFVENGSDENDHIDGDLVLSIERLQEIQDEIEKVMQLHSPQNFVSVFFRDFSCRTEVMPHFQGYLARSNVSHVHFLMGYRQYHSLSHYRLSIGYV